MSDSFKIVLLASACIIHLTEVSYTVKGENCKKPISEFPFDVVRRLEWVDWKMIIFFLTLWLNWQYLPHALHDHMACYQEDDPKSLSQPQKNN